MSVFLQLQRFLYFFSKTLNEINSLQSFLVPCAPFHSLLLKAKDKLGPLIKVYDFFFFLSFIFLREGEGEGES